MPPRRRTKSSPKECDKSRKFGNRTQQEQSVGSRPHIKTAYFVLWQLFQQILPRFVALLVIASIAYSYWYKRIIADEEHGSETSLGSEMFQVLDLPGRGKGLIATRDIKQGELVIREKPLFVVPNYINASPTVLISQLLNQASSSGRREFLDLSYVNFPAHLDAAEHPDEVALAIFQTNAVSISGDRVGIFPRMARLNHGCSSAFNVVYSWRAKEEVLVVHALKNIRKGEELLTTYMNTRRPRSERRQILAEQYGFICSCSVCSLADAQSQASDRRLVEMSNSYDRFASWGEKEIDGVTAIELVRKIWMIEDEEGYRSERGRLAADAVHVAAAHSNAEVAREWAEVAVEWYGYELGEDSEEVAEMKGVVEDVERHGGWGSRDAQP